MKVFGSLSSLLALFCLSVVRVSSIGKALLRLEGQDGFFSGIVGSYNRQLVEAENIKANVRTPNPQSGIELGCEEWANKPSQTVSFIGVVARGNCSFLQKTLNAQKAGATALIVVSQQESVIPMSASEDDLTQNGGSEKIIPTISVPNSFGIALEKLNYNTVVSIEAYFQSIYDPTMFVVLIVATSIAGLGAFYSSDKERASYYGGTVSSFRQHTDIQEINSGMAWSFVIMASASLIFLFYFIRYVFKVMLFFFVCGSINGLTTIGSHIIEYILPQSGQGSMTILRWLGGIQLTPSDIIAAVPATIISLLWFWFRLTDWAWLLQNFMCLGLLMVVQRNVRLTTLRISSILLCTAFIYDIFWVFISPYFFAKSVMVEVATYSHDSLMKDTLPVVLRFPKMNDPLHGPMILGLGDIALPGLLLSYLLRFDYCKRTREWKNGYFLPALIGYAFGLLFTDINLIIMEQGQPALLFLVPCTLGVTVLLGWRRGELKSLWDGALYVQRKDSKDYRHVATTNDHEES